MLVVLTTGQEYHHATKHSYFSVQIDPNYVDASTQPSPFKSYPKFYRRFPLESDNPVHEFIRLTHTITFQKMYRDGPYQLRVNPSAGALYELIDDGIDDYILPGKMVRGIVFLVSCVYYRSSWKYKNRSLRYCFLDSGHHLGAIEASAYLHDRDIQILFDFDKESLNKDLGFENKEFVTACAIAGEIREKAVRKLQDKIPFVCGTDYFEANSFVEAGYRNTILPISKKQQLLLPQFQFDKEKFVETIIKRRSARCFERSRIISQANFLDILQVISQPIPSESIEDLQIYFAVKRVEGMEPGLYRCDREIILIKSGDFSEKTGYLCVNQAIARHSAITIFFVSDLETDRDVLYVMAIG